MGSNPDDPPGSSTHSKIRCWVALQTKNFSVHPNSSSHPPTPLNYRWRCWVLEGRIAFFSMTAVLTPTNWIPMDWSNVGIWGFGLVGEGGMGAKVVMLSTLHLQRHSCFSMASLSQTCLFWPPCFVADYKHTISCVGHFHFARWEV